VLAGGSAVIVHTEDGLDLTAWHAPATGPATGTSVLVLPGNAGSRAARVPLARALSAAGFDVLLLDYRGYGGNPGSPTEQGLAADARAAHHHLVADRGVPPVRLVLFGESLGAAVATRLAQERPVGGLVLRSPFTSLADVGALHYPLLPVRTLLRDRYPVRDMVGSITVPITVVAGQADEIVPPAQSRAVASTAAAQYLEVPGARHNDPDLSYGPVVVDAVVRTA
jgi:pimeloyl-ACP methyl ester carboxylesterase